MHEELLQNSNFHQIRSHLKKEKIEKAREEAKRKLTVQRTQGVDLLDLAEKPGEEDDNSQGGNPDPTSPAVLP